MEIMYYLNELNGNEAYITPCPNGKKILVGSEKPLMVGSLGCRSCEYFEHEEGKTVYCLLGKRDLYSMSPFGRPEMDWW